MRNIPVIVLVFFCCHATGQEYKYAKPSADGTGKFYFGREIAAVMGPGGIDWLEREQRPTEENTAMAIDSMLLTPRSVVADIGAGSGYYSFRIARRVPQGQVLAVDVQQEMLDYLSKKKKDSGFTNVRVVKGDSVSVHLPAGSVDLAFMVDVYHELSHPREIIASVRRSLKPDGRLLLIEYRGEDPAIPIKALHKTTVRQLKKELGAGGFVLEKDGEFLPIQHFLIFRRG